MYEPCPAPKRKRKVGQEGGRAEHRAGSSGAHLPASGKQSGAAAKAKRTKVPSQGPGADQEALVPGHSDKVEGGKSKPSLPLQVHPHAARPAASSEERHPSGHDPPPDLREAPQPQAKGLPGNIATQHARGYVAMMLDNDDGRADPGIHPVAVNRASQAFVSARSRSGSFDEPRKPKRVKPQAMGLHGIDNTSAPAIASDLQQLPSAAHAQPSEAMTRAPGENMDAPVGVTGAMLYAQ